MVSKVRNVFLDNRDLPSDFVSQNLDLPVLVIQNILFYFALLVSWTMCIFIYQNFKKKCQIFTFTTIFFRKLYVILASWKVASRINGSNCNGELMYRPVSQCAQTTIDHSVIKPVSNETHYWKFLMNQTIQNQFSPVLSPTLLIIWTMSYELTEIVCSVTVWQCDSVTVWQCDSVTVL